MNNKIALIITAAGTSTRFGPKDKLSQLLGNKSILEWSLQNFNTLPITEYLITLNPPQLETFSPLLKKYPHYTPILGGATRAESVKNAILSIKNANWVIIHDGARPIVSDAVINALYTALKENPAVITGIPIQDTLKEIDAQNKVVKTYNRSKIVAIQTPQGFYVDSLLAAYKQLDISQIEAATDEAMLMEATHIPIKIIPGDPKSLKITTPNDLDWLNAILDLQSPPKREGLEQNVDSNTISF